MWSSDSSDDEDFTTAKRAKSFCQRISYNSIEMIYEFNERFRLTSHKMECLLELVGPKLSRSTNRNNPMTVNIILQVALHWMGTGSQYHAIGDMHGVSKASVCRAIHSVLSAVNTKVLPLYVKFPENMTTTIEQFYAIRGMPMVCGCLDGTLIKIDTPTNFEEEFVDRHGNHSINCMVVCGPDMQFYYTYANWPGSTHDSRVLKNSALFRKMEDGWRPAQNGILIGDSAYPLKDWLIPPILTDETDESNRKFLRAHRQTRCIVENSISILKEKFPCLNYLRLDPLKACEVFNCCVTLCNFALYNEQQTESSLYDEREDVDVITFGQPQQEDQLSDRQGRTKFKNILNFFRN